MEASDNVIVVTLKKKKKKNLSLPFLFKTEHQLNEVQVLLERRRISVPLPMSRFHRS